MKPFLNEKQLKVVFFALVVSLLWYGIIVAWGATTKNHISKLEIVQKSIIKIFHNILFLTDQIYILGRLKYWTFGNLTFCRWLNVSLKTSVS